LPTGRIGPRGTAPAYPPQDFPEILALADPVVFNSLRQWERFRTNVAASRTLVSCGLRINPEHSEGQTCLYDPCVGHSRLGIRVRDMPERLPDGIDGLHFHTLCESGVEELERTVAAVEQRFAPWLNQIRWINFGGGHHLTKLGYGIHRLVELIRCFRKRYAVEVYLEPGEAVALNAGYLVASVLDIVPGEPEIAILDTSATAHMPDILEMPYRPTVEGAGLPGEFGHPYRLGGLTCLAGDVLGEYSFNNPLHVGDRLVFHDMAHYTMVKNTAFNGIRQPSIVLVSEESRIVRQFGYADYRDRLS
jgi:carboxynorspermidine decarboxylase